MLKTFQNNSAYNSGTKVQPVLEIGKEEDEHEREANHVADKVMKMPDPSASTPKMPDEEEEKMPEEKKVQMMIDEPLKISRLSTTNNTGLIASGGVEKGISESRGNGQPLPKNVQKNLETKMGADLSQVNIHTDSTAIAMNKEIGAKAFTYGNDIYFNSGQYNTSTNTGKHLLAHELTHTVQQKKSSMNTTIQRQTQKEVDDYYTFLTTSHTTEGAPDSKAKARHLVSDWRSATRTLDIEVLSLITLELMTPEVSDIDKSSISDIISNVSDSDLILMFNTYGVNSDLLKAVLATDQSTVNRIDDLVVGQKPVKDQKSFLTTKYGQAPRQWTGYANEPREAGVVKIFETVGAFCGLAPSMLYTIAIGEGLNLYIDANTSKTTVNLNNKVSSFQYLGMDFAAKEIPKVKNLLPASYNKGDEYTEDPPGIRTENGGPTTVYPVTFKNVESGIYALGAILKSRQNTLLSDATSYGYGSPDEDQLLYWTYYYYQRPSNSAADGGPQTLKGNGGFNFLSKPPGAQNGTNMLAKERVSSWHLIRMAKLFSK